MNVSQYEIACDKIYVWKLDLLELNLSAATRIDIRNKWYYAWFHKL